MFAHSIVYSRIRCSCRVNHADKNDIYDFGVILLELMVGRRLKSKSEIDAVKDQVRPLQERRSSHPNFYPIHIVTLVLSLQVQASVAANDVARGSIIDPTIERASSDQSLRTMIEISLRCLQSDPADRPSIEDVLWNLQFAAQVQDAWRDSHSSEGSLGSPL